MSMVFDIFVLAFIVLAIVLLTHFVIRWISPEPAQQADAPGTPAVELRRLELELRALEHRSHSPAYTSVEADAYALLIRQRNRLAGISVPTARGQQRARPTAARLA